MFAETDAILSLQPILYLLVSDGVIASGLDFLGIAMQSHVPQHHHSTQEQSSRVGQVLTSNIRCSSMYL